MSRQMHIKIILRLNSVHTPWTNMLQITASDRALFVLQYILKEYTTISAKVENQWYYILFELYP